MYLQVKTTFDASTLKVLNVNSIVLQEFALPEDLKPLNVGDIAFRQSFPDSWNMIWITVTKLS